MTCLSAVRRNRMNKETELHVNRNFKDTLFRMVFSDKRALLELYNGIKGTDYQNADALKIVTLENAIYMNMKNDLAFLIDGTLSLYEHQSTFAPNMPLRNLFYITREYEKIVSKETLYSSKPIPLPTPEFYVFYNGLEKDWERKNFMLSDVYENKTSNPKLELCVTMININYGKNEELFEKCHTLWEYMMYVEKVRMYSAEMNTQKAVEKAIKESIKEGILKELLIRNRAEAMQVSIFEYDEEREMKLIRRDEREEGKKEGIQYGIEILIRSYLADNISVEHIIEKLEQYFLLSAEEAKEQLMRVRAK